MCTEACTVCVFQSTVMQELSIGSEATIVDWNNFLRDICCQYYRDHMGPIGGIDANFEPIIMEIDESLFMQRKYHRGNHPQNNWVFGGVERGNLGNIFFVNLPWGTQGQPQRDAAALLPLIEDWILPGSHIISDGWGAYRGIPNLGGGIYTHEVIIHRDNFVDPNDPSIHTQTIEGTWSAMKNKMRRMHGTSQHLFESYLCEFAFKRKFPNFGSLLYWIRQYYPV